MNKQDTLLEQLKVLSVEELAKYESAAISACKIINVVGVICCLIMFFYPITLVIIFGILAVGVLANSHVNINNTLGEIRLLISKLKRADK